jgi:hypothetical protein
VFDDVFHVAQFFTPGHEIKQESGSEPCGGAPASSVAAAMTRRQNPSARHRWVAPGQSNGEVHGVRENERARGEAETKVAGGGTDIEVAIAAATEDRQQRTRTIPVALGIAKEEA